MRDPPVWENSLRIAKFRGPRISLSEGRECVENTGLTGKIAFSPHELGDPAGTRTPDLRLKSSKTGVFYRLIKCRKSLCRNGFGLPLVLYRGVK